MAAVLEQCQRGSEDRRKAKTRKHSHSKNKPKKNLRMRLMVNLHWCLISLMFILPGAAALTLEGQKGGNITLPCSSNREDLITVLIFGPIIAYGFNQDKHYKGRVHESGSCDLILQNLNTTDAGKYILKVFANGQQLDSYAYDVRVKANETGRKGEELMFELPREAESVKQITDTSSKEVWRSGQGVLTDRLTIKHFSSSDAGIYRVLNSSGDVLVTMTVTELSTGSKDKQDGTHEDEPHDSELFCGRICRTSEIPSILG